MQILPAGQGTGLRLRKSEILQIVDPKGGQVCDLVAFAWGDKTEWLSNGRSFDYNGTIYLTESATLYSNRSAPMLTIVRDDVGRHDFLFTACSREMYQIQYGVTGPHSNCLDNLTKTLQHLGVESHLVPTPFNIFQNSTVAADGRLHIAPPLSKPGDAIDFRAEMDLDIALSVCSASLCNGGTCTEIAFEIRQEG